MDQLYDIVIIGSGPAGYTAAIYAGRANLRPLVLAGLQPGGQLMITTDVENYPGFPDGILGPDLMDLFQKQAERFGADIRFETVTSVNLGRSPFRIRTEDAEYWAKVVIVSTGATAKWLGLEGEQVFGGFGVSACATCDGFFFRGKEVVVVGGGDTALEEANYLTRHCSKVTIIHRRDSFRASKIMQERIMANPKIEVIWDTEVVEILGDHDPHKRVHGVRLRNRVSGEETVFPTTGVFVAIGHQPNSEIFKGALEMNPLGYLVLQPGSTATNIPGVFAAGDVADHTYRQAITAAGTGCMAAIDAERFLEAHAP